MCGKIRDINGKIFPHEHNVILIEVPEAPDEKDLRVLQEQFPKEKVVCILDDKLALPIK
ncbi:hypothetical protein [endosymbiont GvMRE of Glomus versiforme]|uniref:hypothetical protein n=1 Tax=endosymbiont GvMRE of Glomus versiforme TaxID=2039283 RepID=UPI000EDD210E|nr:hypothetical protein [endosymbiont GvMRE of Glomus versiforme]RHZ36759.1 hypothetical protein GvMRE_I2g75 [endosymbiont GvMRE of Glomus versiforme]